MSNEQRPLPPRSEVEAVDVFHEHAPEMFAQPPPPRLDTWLVVPVSDPLSGFPVGLGAHDDEQDAPMLDGQWTADRPPTDADMVSDEQIVAEIEAELAFERAGELAESLGVSDRLPGAPRKPTDGCTPPIDCWAAYLPFHYYYPNSWGIYLTYEGVQEISKRLGELVPGTPLELRRHAAHLLLFFHEYFHHAVESFATRLEVTHRRPLYIREFQALFERQLPDADEEALATAYALDRCAAHKTPALPRELQRGLVELIREMPPGYARGADLSGKPREATEFKYLNDLQEAAFPEPKKSPLLWDAFPHALSAFGRRSSKVSYLVHIDSPLAERLRARFLRYRELERLLRQAGCEVVGHGKHEKWRSPSGTTAPVPRHPGDLAFGTLKSITMKLLGKTPRDLGLV